jgi:hypothetical protein
MRLTKLSAILSLLITALAFSALCLRAQNTEDSSAGRSGTAPRSSADKYRAQATQSGVRIGAELLTPREVSKEFAADMNGCCLVVHVALYPEKDELLNVSPDDFTLTVEATDTPLRPQSATVISAKLEKNNGSNGGLTESARAGVGVESVTYNDPKTGQPVHEHSVTTSAGAAVGVDGGVPAAVAERDREVIERELTEKGLPEARVTIPVSGYLYFALPKQKKDAKYRLEYIAKGEALSLELP